MPCSAVEEQHVPILCGLAQLVQQNDRQLLLELHASTVDLLLGKCKLVCLHLCTALLATGLWCHVLPTQSEVMTRAQTRSSSESVFYGAYSFVLAPFAWPSCADLEHLMFEMASPSSQAAALQLPLFHGLLISAQERLTQAVQQQQKEQDCSSQEQQIQQLMAVQPAMVSVQDGCTWQVGQQ